MRIITVPGVFQPRSDTWMLADVLRTQTLPAGAAVLDMCTGSGALAVAAALRGARDVTAADVSRRALLCARVNARLNGARVRTRRGDLFAAVGDARYDVIVSNPPYLPSAGDALPERGASRAWEAGDDGRVLLDRICSEAPAHLRPGGLLLLVHSSVCGIRPTIGALAAAGLDADVVARHRGPLGPLLRERARALWAAGRLPEGSLEEELVVVRARRPALGRSGEPARQVPARRAGANPSCRPPPAAAGPCSSSSGPRR